MDKNLLEAVKFDEKGLVCAIAQDAETKRVLMVAWMNAEALQKTVETGFAHYYSRSRQKQWMKGEESGHTQKVRELRLDCDGDTYHCDAHRPKRRHRLPHRARKLLLQKMERRCVGNRRCRPERRKRDLRQHALTASNIELSGIFLYNFAVSNTVRAV